MAACAREVTRTRKERTRIVAIVSGSPSQKRQLGDRLRRRGCNDSEQELE
jgi:hypothetical protein